jgi:uncharacterized phage-like protein YoqJ
MTYAAGDSAEALRGRLDATLQELYARGARTFYSGMAEGFDLLAAQTVSKLKGELEGLKLICVIPFEGRVAKMSTKNRAQYSAICNAADEVVTLAEDYHKTVYLERNDYLIDRAEALICYYSGKQRSGTGYTVTKALKKRIRVINIYADGEQIRFFG